MTLFLQGGNLTGSSDCRPTAVAYFMARLLSKALVRQRWNVVTVSPWQVAFIWCDGCLKAFEAQITTLLQANQDYVPIASLFVATSKALALISHIMISCCVVSMAGLPRPMFEQLQAPFNGLIVRLGDEAIKYSLSVLQRDSSVSFAFH
ncbi:hypothetical protein FGIG_03118 [Fasciola gigantica]|uniref:Uncharacterized protein n=1 Tax=Fasciola gigantica TaxID=46835 RepID=A0A504YTS4_FASGI|nr:hypothetical protein FGIG_03118 [Fasciola gigantica]